MADSIKSSQKQGTLERLPTIVGRLSTARTITGTISKTPVSQSEYAGPYVINPTFDVQVLHTDSKVMTDDVQVKAIAVSRTSNLSGGITVYIGGLE